MRFLVGGCRICRPAFVAWVTAGDGPARTEEQTVTQYLIFFNQQWVGDHPPEWFAGRVEPSMAVVDEMKEAGVYVFAGGLVEDLSEAFSADPTGGSVVITDGPFSETKEWLGGFTVVDVPDLEAARHWAGRQAEGCGWPMEVRRFGEAPT